MRKEEIEMKTSTETSIDAEVATAQSAGIPKFTFSHILAPTDFSPNSCRSVDYAVQLARRLGAKLTLLHIVPEPSALDYPMEGIPAEEIEDGKRKQRKKWRINWHGQSFSTRKSTRSSELPFTRAMKSSEPQESCQPISWLYLRMATPVGSTFCLAATPKEFSSTLAVRPWSCEATAIPGSDHLTS
jgi:hypothetical protein